MDLANQRDQICRRTPLGRLGRRPMYFAAVQFLASEFASFITDHVAPSNVKSVDSEAVLRHLASNGDPLRLGEGFEVG